MLNYLMASNNFNPLNNPLVNYDYKYEVNTGRDPKVQEIINKFPITDTKNGLLVYVENAPPPLGESCDFVRKMLHHH